MILKPTEWFYTNVARRGDNLLVRGYRLADGKPVVEKIPYKPTYYLRSKKDNTGFKDINGVPLEPIEFESMSAARDFSKRYEGVSGFSIYGDMAHSHNYISDVWKGDVPYEFSMLRIFTLDIENLIGDTGIDPMAAAQPLTLVTIHDSQTGLYHVFGYKEDLDNLPNNVVYHKCDNERHMLVAMLAFWVTNYPDIVSGYNSQMYDIIYIVSRITKVLGEDQAKKLSPWGMVKLRNFSLQGKQYEAYEIIGIASMDILELYKKYTFSNQESWKLDYIARITLGENEGKVETSGYSNLDEMYYKDYRKYVLYNIRDVELVIKIEQKMQFIPLVVGVAYAGKVESYPLVYGPVRYFETYIGQYLKAQKIFFPYAKNHAEKETKYEGAYVSDPDLGAHDWCVSVDAASLYPNMLISANAGPDTIINNVPRELEDLVSRVSVDAILKGELDLSLLKKYNYSLGANGALYDRSREGFLSVICKEFLDGRDVAKKEMKKVKNEIEKIKKVLAHRGEEGLDPAYATLPDAELNDLLSKKDKLAKSLENKQKVLKVLANSIYGCIGQGNFLFFDVRIAETITLNGQCSVRTAGNAATAKLTKFTGKEARYNIYNDTDSAYLALKNVVDMLPEGVSKEKKVNFLDKFIQKEIDPTINDACAALADYMNWRDNRLNFKREAIAERGIWRGKKMYVLSVLDNEGVRYAEPDIKVTGIECVRSSTPEWCRKKIKEGLRLMLTDTEENFQAFIAKTRDEWMNTLEPEKMAFPRGVNNIKEYRLGDKGVPIHVRAALLYNAKIKELGLTNEEEIRNGSKIKFVYLKEPNRMKSNVIGFVGKIPEEFGIASQIDRKLQFEKAFLSPFISLCHEINWDVEPKSTLDAWF